MPAKVMGGQSPPAEKDKQPRPAPENGPQTVRNPLWSQLAFGGSVAAALQAAQNGAAMLRVHDVAETVQALKVWRAAQG